MDPPDEAAEGAGDDGEPQKKKDKIQFLVWSLKPELSMLPIGSNQGAKILSTLNDIPWCATASVEEHLLLSGAKRWASLPQAPPSVKLSAVAHLCLCRPEEMQGVRK